MEDARLCQIVTPVGMLGYGFNEQHTEHALQEVCALPTPSALILDSGSTDSGPNKLALGSMSNPRSAYERDLRRLLRLGQKYRVPVITASAGGDGTDHHVEELVSIIQALAEEEEFRTAQFKVVSLFSNMDKDFAHQRFQAGKVRGCGSTVPPLTNKAIDETTTIVAQMGPEPIFDAIVANPDFDVLIAGRSYDPSPYIAFSAYHATLRGQKDISSLSREALGAFNHMGKIMECGGLCSTPKSMGAVACLYRNDACSFTIKPTDPHSMCTPLTVAAHSLYEKSRPDILYGPGGHLNVTKCQYEQLDDGRTVKVWGSVFDADPYTVKMEGARVVGYRTIFLGSFSDPVLLRGLRELLSFLKNKLRHDYADIGGKWDVEFHVSDTGSAESAPKNVSIVGEIVAETQAIATQLANTARVWCIHAPYAGQRATAGNMGFGIGGRNEFEAGPCCEFSVYHLADLQPGEERGYSYSVPASGTTNLFRWKVLDIDGGGRRKSSERSNADGVSHANGSSPNGTQADSTSSSSFAINGNMSKITQAVPHLLPDVARVLRSKNSGPFEITIDIMFHNQEIYNIVRKSNVLNRAVIQELYSVTEDDIIYCDWFEPALAFKVTIPRYRNGKRCAAGGFMESDMHGSQWHVPLMMMELSEAVQDEIVGIEDAKNGTY
ncbi:hypothetical protein LTS08_001044 [Lithohypha guttulata]|uniref:Caib baif family enzyme n=1 Tax=Lithohypha guttulata TaxID=1690604 RepID=A0AAN7T3C4_9EURO|nr:hypothetical protein LTR51_006344 [Lithohypha guttulata]KAK5088550.1 hypothetical protein LTR05_002770 [Lithohypha guttulata]KAK5106921.1 hypothetical protein LTS08_001044 [Lithohypha guttulata]